MKNPYYDTIAKCPLSRFIDCYVDRNYRSLIIGDDDGTIEDFVLQAAYMQMIEEYARAIGNADQTLYIRTIKEVNLLASDVKVMHAIVETMQTAYTEYFASLINKMLCINIRFTAATDWDNYQKQVAHLRSRIKGFEMRMEMAQERLKEIEKKMRYESGDNKITPSREFFISVLNILEEQFSINISEETITVLRYCERVRRLNNLSKNKKSVKNGRSKR